MTRSVPVAHDVLAGLPLFSGLTPEQIALIAAGSRRVPLAKGAILFHQGEPAHGIYFVLAGQMQLSLSSPDGSEKVVEIIAAGESFGEAVVFLGEDYPVTATALLPTTLLCISRTVVLDLIERDPLVARRMLANMAFRLHRMIQDVESYALRSGSQRVVGFLLGEVGGVRASTDPGSGREPDVSQESAAHRERTITLPASKRVLASRLNLAPETFSRILQELSAAGLISVHGRRIVVHDPAKLAATLEWR